MNNSYGVKMINLKNIGRFIFYVLAMATLFHLSVLGADAEKIVKEIQKKYQKSKSLEIQFKEINRFKLTGTSSEVFGTFIIKDQDNYRLDSETQIIATDGTVFWRYNKIENQVLIDHAKKENQEVLLNNFLYDLQQKYYGQIIDEYKETGKKIYVIKLTPKESSESFFTSIKIWVENGSWKINKVIYTDYNENETEYEIENISFDKKFPDSLFTFVPPAGSEVVDVRF
jgi:outer membrane lipoprotein-sorting protein